MAQLRGLMDQASNLPRPEVRSVGQAKAFGLQADGELAAKLRNLFGTFGDRPSRPIPRPRPPRRRRSARSSKAAKDKPNPPLELALALDRGGRERAARPRGDQAPGRAPRRGSLRAGDPRAQDRPRPRPASGQPRRPVLVGRDREACLDHQSSWERGRAIVRRRCPGFASSWSRPNEPARGEDLAPERGARLT